MNDQSVPAAAVAELLERVRDAAARQAVLRVRGHGSKDFLGDARRGELLDVRSWSGIEQYEPNELTITVRAGTPLGDVEAALAERGQYLPFEPPHWAFAGSAKGAPRGPTLGGVVAVASSGPGRASRGAVRDHVLGTRLINGRAEVLRLGGSVMKNVAGFDLSRLLVGSMGTLGVLLDVTLKVLPQPASTASVRMDMSQGQALEQINRWVGQALPLDACAWWDGLLVLRLGGARAAVATALQQLHHQGGAERIDEPAASAFWCGLRDQSDEFFARARVAVEAGGLRGVTLWRLSVPATSAPLGLPGEELIEWFGAQRWVCTAVPALAVHERAAQAGGHAQAFYTTDVQARVRAGSLSPVLEQLHRRVQRAFDPHGVFDTGRLLPSAS